MPSPSAQCPALRRVPYRAGSILIRCDLARGHRGNHVHDEVQGFEHGIPSTIVTTWPRPLVRAAERLSDTLAHLLHR